MPMLSYVHQLFSARTVPSLHPYAAVERSCPPMSPVPESRRRSLGEVPLSPRVSNATGVMAASAPSMISPIPCSTRASGRWRTGFSPPSCCASRVRLGVSPESWGSIAARAIAGAGGCAMRPSPMRSIASWRAPWKRMTSITPLARRAKRKQGGKKALGRRARGRRKKREPGRGHYDKDRPAIIAWVSRQGACRHPSDQRFHGEDGAESGRHRGARGQSALHGLGQQLSGAKGYMHEFVNHTQKEYARGDVHENRAECLFSLLKPYLRVFRGLSKTNLPGYVGFFQFLRNFRQQNAFEQAELILQAALDPAIASRAQKGRVCDVLGPF